MKNKKNIKKVKILIAFVAIFLYFNTLSAEFVYDDTEQVMNNPWIRDIKYIPDIFFSNVWSFLNENSQSSYYRPLMHLHYLITNKIFGINPFGFHLVNILYHAGISVLVFLVTLNLFKTYVRKRSSKYQTSYNFSKANAKNELEGAKNSENKIEKWLQDNWPMWPAALAGILFAAHPIHTEVVAWVAALPELSCTFFFLLSFYFYIKKERKKSIPHWSLFFFLLAAFSKEPALALPIILFFYEATLYYKKEKPKQFFKYAFKKILPFIGVAFIYFIFRFIALRGLITNVLNPEFDLTPYEFFINIFPLFVDYMGKLIAPINLNAFYSFHPIYSILESKALLAIVLIFLLIFIWLKTWSRNKLAFLSVVWIVLPLLPALYLPAIAGGAYFSERYLYLPSVGFVIIVAYLIDKITRIKIWNIYKILAALLAIVLLWSSLAIIRRNITWQYEHTILEDILKKSPDIHVPYNRLGFYYHNQGEFEKAIKHFHKAIDLKSDYVDAYYNLGNAYQELGRMDLAIQNYKKAIKIHPNYSAVYNNMGIVALKIRDLDRAKEYFEKAIEINPKYGDALANLGIIYRNLGDLDKAIKYHKLSLDIFKDHMSYYTLGVDYQLKKDCNQAITYYQKALKIEPNFSQAQVAMERCKLN